MSFGGEELQQKRSRARRLTLDISADLHRKIKVHAAQSERPMGDVVRQVLEQHFADPPRTPMDS